MSTRGAVIIKRKSDKVYMYRHCDGYALHEDIENMVKTQDQSIWLYISNFCHTLHVYDNSIRINECIPSDVEYICVVDLDEQNIKMYDVEWFNGLDACEEYLDRYEIIYDKSFNAANKPIDYALVDKLKTMLHEGIVAFKYCKVNGEIRKAIGTLDSSKSEGLAKYVASGKYSKPDNVVCYWDIEKDAWRTFRNENLIEIF